MGWAEMHCQRPSSPPSDWSQCSLVFVSARPQEGDRDLKGTSTCTSQKQVGESHPKLEPESLLVISITIWGQGHNILVWATHSWETDAEFTQHNFSPDFLPRYQESKASCVKVLWPSCDWRWVRKNTANELQPMSYIQWERKRVTGNPFSHPYSLHFLPCFFHCKSVHKQLGSLVSGFFLLTPILEEKYPVFSKLTSVDNWAG